MSISNHSVDVTASTADLEGLLKSFEDSLEALNEGDLLSEANADTAEWLESGIEIIEDELAKREDEEIIHGPAYNTPSLEDRGIELGSYAS